MRTRCSGALLRETSTATVAAMSDMSTKKCHGWNVVSCWRARTFFRGAASVEIAELILQPFREGAVRRHGGGGGRCAVLLRPSPRRKPQDGRAGRTHDVRQ